MENLERVQARLNRIRAIQPVLTALRTISLASWQVALGRRTRIQHYREHLARIAEHSAIHLPAHEPLGPVSGDSDGRRQRPGRVAVLVVGSERGLCGRYNTAAVERAEAYLSQEALAEAQVELMALGSRIAGIFERHDHTLAWSGKLSLTKLPPFDLALDLAQEWLSRYGRSELAGAYVVYNNYRGIARYEPQVVQIIPPPRLRDEYVKPDETKPAPVIETDPASLYRRLIEQLTAARLHEVLITSAAAEHSTRYQLMDGAAQNAERIVGELTLAIHGARQQAITREMQELAAGAGLIGQRAS